MSNDLKFLFDVNSFGDDTLEYQLTSLNKSIIDILKDSIDIHGVALFTIDGLMAILIAKNEKHYSNLKQLSDTVSQLQPKKYFSTLPDEIEYRGPGYMDFTDFEVYFVKISDQLIISFIATDIHFQVFEHTREIIKSVIKMMEMDPEEIKKEEIKKYDNVQKKEDGVDEVKDVIEETDTLEKEIKFTPKRYEDKFAPKRVDPRSLLRPVKNINEEDSSDERDELTKEAIKNSEETNEQIDDKNESVEETDTLEKEIKFTPKRYEDKFAPKRVDPRTMLRPVKNINEEDSSDERDELTKEAIKNSEETNEQIGDKNEDTNKENSHDKDDNIKSEDEDIKQLSSILRKKLKEMK